MNNMQNSTQTNIPPCKVVLKDILKERNKDIPNSQDLGDGNKVKIFKCKASRCGLKNQFVAKDKCISTCTKRIYNCITPPGTVYVDCHTSNVIYMLTCSSCGLQYIGETSPAVKCSLHWTSIWY